MHIIDKTFEFCYGHRVWTQRLNQEYSENAKCACRHKHGHEGKVHIFLTSNTLDDTGMVTDFRHLEWLKKWINTYIDHQFILDKNDPIYPRETGGLPLIPVYIPDTQYCAGYTLDLSSVKSDTPEYEIFEGMFIVDFVPTSENLSRWMTALVQEKMTNLGVTVQRVEWWETPKSRATYVSSSY